MYQTNRESQETFRIKNVVSKNSNTNAIITLDPNETKHQMAPSLGKNSSSKEKFEMNRESMTAYNNARNQQQKNASLRLPADQEKHNASSKLLHTFSDVEMS